MKRCNELKNKVAAPKKLRLRFLLPLLCVEVFFFLLMEYQKSEPKSKDQCKELLEYLIEILSSIAKKDRWASRSNVAHSDEEIARIVNEIDWQKGSPQAAQALGKFYASLTGLSYALYRDFFNDEGCEIYGPYNAHYHFGKNTIVTIKHFPRIKPRELWPEIAKLKYSDVKIYQVYRNVSFRCELWGVHHIFEGDIINDLVAYAVFADDKTINSLEEIKELVFYFADTALEQSLVYERMSKEDLKKKNLEWLCWKFVDFFKLARMDWRPTEEMWNAVKDKAVANRMELGTFPSFEEYTTSPKYEAYWLKDLYARKGRKGNNKYRNHTPYGI